MIELDIRRLPKNQQKKVQGAEFDALAESLIAEEFGLSELTNADWYDCVDRDSGTKYEVKSTSTQIGKKDRYKAKGRFRLWENQHRSLTASEGQNSAWYAFVLLDLDSGTIKIQRRRPTTVTKIVNDRSGFGPSGHDSKGRQHKLPYSSVLY